MKTPIIVLLVLSLLASCKPKQWLVSDIKSSVIQIDSTKNTIADKKLQAFYKIYKDSMEHQTSVIIGHAAKTLTMDRTLHENPLANFISDALCARANDLIASLNPPASENLTGTGGSSSKREPERGVDFALMNFGGIRASLPQGNITVGNIMTISPFENEIVILALKGSDVRDLVNVFAASGGQGVSGMTFGIRNGEAVNVLIDGKPIDDSREYIIATIDYVALGGDNMTPLLRARQVLIPGIKIRDLMIDTIKRAAERGESIDANLDGRVYLVNDQQINK